MFRLHRTFLSTLPLVPVRIANVLHLNAYATHRRRARPHHVLPQQRLSEKKMRRNFVDSVAVRAKGGNGGSGMLTFSSLPSKEYAGPDGGDGGNGGHVIITASRDVNSLSHVKRVIKGKDGIDGKTKCQHGKSAEHVYVPVPLGTQVKDKTTGERLAELVVENQQYVLSRGGAGGRGNRYYLSNELRAPVMAERGGTGEEKELLLEMKISAHIGLVGFPNAGKSTLLTVLSRAKPKVADYPFTTLRPHIGMVPYSDGLQVSVTDIPGLIEGSHLNKGLGISFLRHIEKCACLLYILDASTDEPWKTLELLQYELEQYQVNLSRRPHAVIANKMDLPKSTENIKKLQSEISLPLIAVSGKEKINIDLLKSHIRTLYERFAVSC